MDNESVIIPRFLVAIVSISPKSGPKTRFFFSSLRAKFNQLETALISRIARKYCLISTSYLARLFDIRTLYLTELFVFFTSEDTL